ncbi:hypothetical protein [Rhodobacter capsulatus]|uniref:hypothetical protein n=1 Tax=Rhodobacter capsulatus TaxID=1061 RepID=UPI0040296921
MTGYTTSDLPNAPLADEVIVNRNGSTGRQRVADLSTQLAGSGPLAEQIAALPTAAELQTVEQLALSARDIAVLNSATYPDEATGRAAVADGAYFKVIGSGDVAYLEYRRTNATTSVLVATYASKQYIDSKVGIELLNSRARDTDLIHPNEMLNADLSQGPIGTITPPTGSGGYTSTVPQLPGGFVLAKTGAGGWPEELALVDRIWPDLGTTRAIRARMIRATSAVFDDMQLRQIMPIPEEYWGRSDLSVTVVFAYESEATSAAPVALVTTSATKTSGYTDVATTRVNEHVAGSKTIGVFRAMITDPAARFVAAGPRLHTQFVADHDAVTYIGPIAVYFDRPDVVRWEPSREMRVKTTFAEVETVIPGLRRPSRAMTNPMVNARLLDATIGQTSAPTGWGVATGGSGTTGAAWRIAAPPADLPSVLSCNVFEVDHYNNGTVRTDRQFSQRVAIPAVFRGTNKILRILQLVKRSAPTVHFSVLGTWRDADGASVGSIFAFPSTVAEPAAGAWGVYVCDIPMSQATAAYIDLLFRTQMDAGSGVVSGVQTWQTLFAAWFDAGDLRDFDRNLEDDIRRIAGSLVDASLGSGINPNDRWIGPTGMAHRVKPVKSILALGDSQSAAMNGATILGILNGYQFATWGIGAETSAQILNRARGFLPNLAGLSFGTSGTKRLRARRTVPARIIDEAYRSSWQAYSSAITEPRAVDFYSATGYIGTSAQRFKATATVSGDTLTASGHPFAAGDHVYFLDSIAPANAYKAKTYYVRDVSGSTFKLAEFPAGPAISFSAFGGTLTLLGDFYLDWAYVAGQDSNITTVTHADTDDYVWHICAGTNDFNGSATVTDVFNNIREMVRQIKAANARFIVSGIPGFYGAGGEWSIGGAAYAKMMELSGLLAVTWPDNYLDIYAYLLTQGNGGENDNADIAAGLVPRSLRVSATDGHLGTSTGQIKWQTKIANMMVAKGWS